MRIEKDHRHHAVRARAELEAAYRAGRPEIAAVRLKLCSLYIRRARSLLRNSAPVPVPAPIHELDWLERCATFHEKCLADA